MNTLSLWVYQWHYSGNSFKIYVILELFLNIYWSNLSISAIIFITSIYEYRYQRERERESGAIAIDIVYQQLYSCNRHYYFYYHREFDIPSCDISDKVCRELHIWFYNICTIRITLHKCVSNSAVWSPTAKISMIKHQIAHRLSILRNRWHPISLMYSFPCK